MNYESQTLYSKAKGGEIRQWRTWALDGVVHFEHGLVGGTLIEDSYVAVPKNVGRSNATTSVTQAVAESKAKYVHKLARKYATSPEEAQEPLEHLPMLAKAYGKYDKQGDYKITGDGKKFQWPAYAQPKFDGFRCLARWEGDDIIMTSRQGKEFTVPHIAAQLRDTMPRDITFDGELFLPGLNASTIASLVKKNQPGSEHVQYVVYDCIAPDMSTSQCDRLGLIEEVVTTEWTVDKVGQVVRSPVEAVESYDQAKALERKWVIEDGHEGAIIRDLRNVYVYAHRSNFLLKVKVFEDAEFIIADINADKKGLGVFQCWAPDAKDGDPMDDRHTFGVTMGSHAERRAQLASPEDFIGKPLKVRYAFMTEASETVGLAKPFHPVGVMLRPEWD